MDSLSSGLSPLWQGCLSDVLVGAKTPRHSFHFVTLLAREGLFASTVCDHSEHVKAVPVGK